MGAVSLKIGDGTARFKTATFCSSAVNGLMVFSVLITNLFALYAFTYNPHTSSSTSHHHHNNISLISDHVSLILKEIDSSQKKLTRMEKQILGYDTIDLSTPNLPSELKLFLRRHSLPLGKDSKTGITEMVSSVGHSCAKSIDLLSQLMTYKPYGRCPDDLALPQKLLSRGCEPLPRRRCLSANTALSKAPLLPFPESLWKPVSDKSLSWSGLACKNFTCLKKKLGGRDLFDLEAQRFVKAKGKNDFMIEDVLGLGGGGIRIGFDIGGGSGSFAARMGENNVTVVTQALNVEAPYNEFIAARGLFPLFLSLDHRFPFYDGVLDLVHAGSSSLDVDGKPEKVEFLMFDIDRILRVGGLLWLDNFLCVSDENKRDLTRLIDRFGYKKLKWVVGEKPASPKPHLLLSAVLQKPVRA